jgi:hypothetical protein
MLAVTPFLNNNSFSNLAMAQEYDKYGHSSYSTYRTDDKKYECRTGPFEGFFVSSVEFCKHVKFDDRKDNNIYNRTGTQVPPVPAGHQGLQDVTGPPGPQGIQDPIGPNGTQDERGFNGTQCEPGLNRIEPTSLYLVEGTINTTLATGSTTSIAMCNPGDIVFFGTYITLRSDIVDSEYDIPLLPNFNGWLASINEDDPTGTVTVRAFATCFDNPP